MIELLFNKIKEHEANSLSNQNDFIDDNNTNIIGSKVDHNNDKNNENT